MKKIICHLWLIIHVIAIVFKTLLRYLWVLSSPFYSLFLLVAMLLLVLDPSPQNAESSLVPWECISSYSCGESTYIFICIFKLSLISLLKKFFELPGSPPWLFFHRVVKPSTEKFHIISVQSISCWKGSQRTTFVLLWWMKPLANPKVLFLWRGLPLLFLLLLAS